MAAEEPDVINLSRGQAGFLPLEAVYAEARRATRRDDKGTFRYEKAAGSTALRRSIAEWYGRLFNLEVDPDFVAVTVGGTGAIALAFQTFTAPGDQIVIPDPAYPFYVLCAAYGLDGREITRLCIGASRVDRAALEPVMRKNLQMVVLTSPHNPSGVVYDEAGLRPILDLAQREDFFVLYDENHCPEVYDGRKHLPIQLLDGTREHSIMLGSVSRLGLQGERIGWAVLPRIRRDIATTYVAQSPFASTRAQRLASFVLDNYETLGFDRVFLEYEEKRNLLIPAINEVPGFECRLPEGGSYAFVRIAGFVAEHRSALESVVREQSWKRGIAETEVELSLRHNSLLVSRFLLYGVGIGVVPGVAYGPGSDDYVRFTFAAERSEIERAIDRLKRIQALLDGGR